MQRFQRWAYIFAAFVVLLSGCSNTDGSMIEEDITKANTLLASVLQSESGSEKLENNECLNCHSDKDLLIETAKPEEVVESESKGVG